MSLYPLDLHDQRHLFSHLPLSSSAWAGSPALPKESKSLSLHLPPSFPALLYWTEAAASPSASAKLPPPYFLLSPDLGRGKSGFEMSCSIANACCTLLLLWFNCTVPAGCCGPQSVCTEQAWPGNDLRLVAELLYFNLLINFLLRIEKWSLATGLGCISGVLRITWGLIWCLINIPQLKLLNVAQFWCSFCHSLERLCSL